MSKKMWYGFVAVFITLEVLMFIVDSVLLGSTYVSIKGVWREDMMSKMWIFHLVNVCTAFFFSFIFSKGFENKGIMEGIRYGFYIGIWMSIPAAFATYAMIKVPGSLAFQWFIYGVIEYVIAGIVLATVFKGAKPKEATA